jgi:peptide/nickel transport system ATP-binding protein
MGSEMRSIQEVVPKKDAAGTEESLLQVKNLRLSFVTRAGRIQAIDNVSFEIKRGESFGLVGETGCGKSQTALAVMRLTPDSGIIEHGEIWFEGTNLASNITKEFELISFKRGKKERYKIRRNKSQLKKMNSAMAEIRGKEISIIFQEPMTSLNPVYTVGRQISEVLLTHSLQSIANRIIARGSASEKSLKEIVDFITIHKDLSRSDLQDFLKTLGLEGLGDQLWFIVNRKDIGFSQKIQIIFSIRYRRPSTQTMKYLRNVQTNENRISFGYIIMNKVPFLNNSFIGLLRKEALAISYELLSLVNMPNAESVIRQYPHELSGGMRQRVMIAMAIAAKPKLIIADEPTSALDVTVQAQILGLLRDLKETFGTSLLFISHDMGVISEICDRVGVMYAGNIVEVAPIDDLFEKPKHPYTQGLLEAIPKNGDKRETLQTIKGELPSLIDPPSGCRFNNRCPFSFDKCSLEPPWVGLESEHYALCWLYASEDHRVDQ